MNIVRMVVIPRGIYHIIFGISFDFPPLYFIIGFIKEFFYIILKLPDSASTGDQTLFLTAGSFDYVILPIGIIQLVIVEDCAV